MLNISTKNGEYAWQVRAGWLHGPYNPYNPEDVVSVQADGDELRFIEEHATGLPTCNNGLQTWYGDHAKWIVANLIR